MSGDRPTSVARPWVSVVIPALDEEGFLPDTLAKLRQQTLAPSEIIVADAGSSDETVRIARAHGCRVVEGGLPAVGRNHGAKEARGRWLLFLDADVLVPPHGIEAAVSVAERRGLDGLSCWFEPDQRTLPMRVSHWLSAAYFWLTTKVRWPHSIGGFLLVRRDVHHRLDGFDETILVGEDQDLRASDSGGGAIRLRPVADGGRVRAPFQP